MGFDSISDLRLFVTIFEHGSITGASELLGITPAVASKRLQRLERSAGEALFHRSTRTLSPTGAGAVLYDYARSVLATVADAEAQLAGDSEPSGFIRLTSSLAFGRMYLAPVITEFLKAYRAIRVDAVFTDAVLDMVDDSVDIAIRICMPSAYPNLVMRRLCSGRRYLCASPAYLRAFGSPALPRDLKQHNCIVLNAYDVWKLTRERRVESVRVAGSLHVNDSEAVLDAVRNDLGIGVVALWNGARDIESQRIVRVLEEYELSPQPDVFAVYHPRQKTTPRIRHLLTFIESRLETLAGLPV